MNQSAIRTSSPDMTNEGSVNYTVKELLAMLEKTLTEQMRQISVGVDELGRKLDLKASEARVDALERRLKAAEDTIVDWRVERAGPQAVSRFQKAALYGAWLLICSAFSGLLIILLGGVHA